MFPYKNKYVAVENRGKRKERNKRIERKRNKMQAKVCCRRKSGSLRKSYREIEG